MTGNTGGGEINIARERVKTNEYRFSNGIINDLFIYDRALSRTEIQQFYKVHLNDLIYILNVMTDAPTPMAPPFWQEISGDNLMGIEEAIYAAEWITGLHNHCPALNDVGNMTVDENSDLSFSVSAFDADLDTLTFGAPVLPEGAYFEPNTRTFSWTPTYDQSGPHDATFTVSDGSNCDEDSETIVITVNDVALFSAEEYFPLSVGNWWDYRNEETGNVERSEVTGTRLVGGTETLVFRYPAGEKDYYTSDSNGVRLHGLYVISDEYTGNVDFDSPLLYMANYAEVGTLQVSETTFPLTVYGQTVDVDVTTRTEILSVENVTIGDTVYVDCIKVSVQATQEVQVGESHITISSDTAYYWFYKGVGPLKRFGSDGTETIVASKVNGEERTY
jgi:hypothetical protein